jgi:hypothetical protein
MVSVKPDWEYQADIRVEVDQVNHPPHYQFPNGVEAIDLIEHLSFNRGAAVKYLVRAGRKATEDEIRDLKKAAWFVNREIKRLEKK